MGESLLPSQQVRLAGKLVPANRRRPQFLLPWTSPYCALESVAKWSRREQAEATVSCVAQPWKSHSSLFTISSCSQVALSHTQGENTRRQGRLGGQTPHVVMI